MVVVVVQLEDHHLLPITVHLHLVGQEIVSHKHKIVKVKFLFLKLTQEFWNQVVQFVRKPANT